MKNFNSGNPLDLDFHCVVWQPNTTGGFDVRTVQLAPCVPAGTVSGVVLNSAGNPVANCPVVVTSSGDPSDIAVRQSAVDGTFQVDGVSVPGGINVRVLPIDGIDPATSASGILWHEGDTLEVVVGPAEPVLK